MDKQLIDDCFYVKEKRYGTFDSYDTEDKPLVTSLTEESCIAATRFLLQLRQETKLNEVGVAYTGNVSNKL